MNTRLSPTLSPMARACQGTFAKPYYVDTLANLGQFDFRQPLSPTLGPTRSHTARALFEAPLRRCLRPPCPPTTASLRKADPVNGRKARERRKTLLVAGRPVDPHSYAHQSYAGPMAELGLGLGKGLHVVYVYHEPDCPLLSGRGLCTCRAEVSLRGPGDAIH